MKRFNTRKTQKMQKIMHTVEMDIGNNLVTMENQNIQGSKNLLSIHK